MRLWQNCWRVFCGRVYEGVRVHTAVIALQYPPHLLVIVRVQAYKAAACTYANSRIIPAQASRLARITEQNASLLLITY